MNIESRTMKISGKEDIVTNRKNFSTRRFFTTLTKDCEKIPLKAFLTRILNDDRVIARKIISRIIHEKDAVRQTMEQIDIVYRMIQTYPDAFQLALTASDISKIFSQGKFASLIGMEGGHSIDSSLSTLRMFYQLGARYMTLTHACNTPWAQSCCDANATVIPDGLTDFGVKVVQEMNRLGMMIDISHVAVSTMKRVLSISKAPVIFSHSSVYSICNNPRNVPDDVLQLLKQNKGLIMINFYNEFLTCSEDATLANVAEHIDYVKNLIGIEYVGLGADYDGVDMVPIGLEDASKYVFLTGYLIEKYGYSDSDIASLIGDNLLRVLSICEEVSLDIKISQIPYEDIIEHIYVQDDQCRTGI